jgi:hypothetical protein
VLEAVPLVKNVRALANHVAAHRHIASLAADFRRLNRDFISAAVAG